MLKFKTNETVLAAYIQQSVPSVTNPRETLWFNGTKLYSYRSLLAIIEPLDKVLFIDYNIRTYSNTTAKQTHLLISEAYNFNIYFIPLEESPVGVLQFYWNQIEEFIKKFDRARTLKSTYKEIINSNLDSALSYVEYMKVNKKSKEYKYLTQITKELFKRKIL